MSTTTDFYSGAGDGECYNKQSTWSASRDGLEGIAAYYEIGAGGLMIQTTNTNQFFIWRSWIPFDTSLIGAGSTVTAATLTLTSSDWVGSDNRVLSVVAPTTQASTSAITTADFDQCALNTPDECATRKAFGDWAAPPKAASMTFNATGISHITVDGWTMLGLRCGTKDVDNVAPANNGWIAFDASETAGTTDPVLSVTYDAAGGGTTVNPTISYSPTSSTGAGGAMGV